MKPHYFDQEQADIDDTLLQMCCQQGYVPTTCLLGGNVVWRLTQAGLDPCEGCEGPRNKCNGRRSE